MSSAKADKWTADVPTTVAGLSGSCVVIPCTFHYPATGKTYSTFTGIWHAGNADSKILYHTNPSKISGVFNGRTSLIGDLHHNNCSLKISSLRASDTGQYMFRIEIDQLDKFSYGANKVSIQVKGKRTFSLKGFNVIL